MDKKSDIPDKLTFAQLHGILGRLSSAQTLIERVADRDYRATVLGLAGWTEEEYTEACRRPTHAKGIGLCCVIWNDQRGMTCSAGPFSGEDVALDWVHRQQWVHTTAWEVAPLDSPDQEAQKDGPHQRRWECPACGCINFDEVHCMDDGCPVLRPDLRLMHTHKVEIGDFLERLPDGGVTLTVACECGARGSVLFTGSDIRDRSVWTDGEEG
jgi:hypothetical protein